MDSILQYIINLTIFVPIIIVLILASIKLSKVTLSHLGTNKYVKVLDKTSLSKDTDVFVLKIGDEGCVLISSPSKTEKIKELSKEEIELVEEINKNNTANMNNSIFNKIKLSDLKINKLKLKENENGRLG